MPLRLEMVFIMLVMAIQIHWPARTGEIMGMEPSVGQSITWTASFFIFSPELQVKSTHALSHNISAGRGGLANDD